TDTNGIEIHHFFTQPAEIENSVNPDEDVIVWKQLPKRAAHVEFELIAFLAAEHSVASEPHADTGRESGNTDFFNRPHLHNVRCSPTAGPSITTIAQHASRP